MRDSRYGRDGNRGDYYDDRHRKRSRRDDGSPRHSQRGDSRERKSIKSESVKGYQVCRVRTFEDLNFADRLVTSSFGRR